MADPVIPDDSPPEGKVWQVGMERNGAVTRMEVAAPRASVLDVSPALAGNLVVHVPEGACGAFRLGDRVQVAARPGFGMVLALDIRQCCVTLEPSEGFEIEAGAVLTLA